MVLLPSRLPATRMPPRGRGATRLAAPSFGLAFMRLLLSLSGCLLKYRLDGRLGAGELVRSTRLGSTRADVPLGSGPTGKMVVGRHVASMPPWWQCAAPRQPPRASPPRRAAAAGSCQNDPHIHFNFPTSVESECPP
jgi:hypothetical protein